MPRRCRRYVCRTGMALWHSSRQIRSRFISVDALLNLQQNGEKTDAAFDVVGFLRPGLVGADEVIERGFSTGVPLLLRCMSPFVGPSRHFAATQQLSRFRSEAYIRQSRDCGPDL